MKLHLLHEFFQTILTGIVKIFVFEIVFGLHSVRL